MQKIEPVSFEELPTVVLDKLFEKMDDRSKYCLAGTNSIINEYMKDNNQLFLKDVEVKNLRIKFLNNGIGLNFGETMNEIKIKYISNGNEAEIQRGVDKMNIGNKDYVKLAVNLLGIVLKSGLNDLERLKIRVQVTLLFDRDEHERIRRRFFNLLKNLLSTRHMTFKIEHLLFQGDTISELPILFPFCDTIQSIDLTNTNPDFLKSITCQYPVLENCQRVRMINTQVNIGYARNQILRKLQFVASVNSFFLDDVDLMLDRLHGDPNTIEFGMYHAAIPWENVLMVVERRNPVGPIEHRIRHPSSFEKVRRITMHGNIVTEVIVSRSYFICKRREIEVV